MSASLPLSSARIRTFLHDLAASLVVFLVAVPLSMGIALASGAPIASGLIAAAIGGIVVGVLAGAPLQVSGPAAGLVVIVFGFIQELGWPALGVIIVAAGLLQVALGAAGVARAAMAISPAVIHGMLAGIGVQIALAQMHVLLGGAPESSAVKNLAGLPGQLADLHTRAALLGLVTIALLLAWPRIDARWAKAIPAPLVAVVVATAASVALGLDVPRVQIPASFREVVALPSWPAGKAKDVAIAAATLAFVASAESLLCAVATDKLHGGPRVKLDRELVAQGVGNVVSGLAGGLPITGVIVRSTANISAGARTRLSAVLHGVWVIVLAVAFGSVLRAIPLSVLAALLVVVGARLVSPQPVRELVRHKEASVYFVTLAGVLFINLLAGIALGVAWAAVRLLRRRAQVGIDIERADGRAHVVVRGALTFLGVPKLVAALEQVRPGDHVDLDLDVEVMDHAGFEAIHSFRAAHERTGGRVDVDQRHEHWLTGPARRPLRPASNTSAGGAETR